MSLAQEVQKGIQGKAGAPLEFLIVRADRLGDVILSTPVFEVIKRNYPRSRVTVMVTEQVASVIRGLPSVDEVMIYDPCGRHAGFRGFLRLCGEIKKHRFRIAILLQSQRKIAFAVYFAGIRYRVGPLSKIHSYFLFNRGMRQRRSNVEMHEADYNLQLLRKIGIRVGSRNIATRVQIGPEAKAEATEWLKAQGWKGEPFIAVHPGMGGSALNWPETHYVEFIRGLLKDGKRIVMTGGSSEGALLGRIRDAVGMGSDAIWVYGGPTTGPVDRLGALFSEAALVVAPSTGPLHVAVALGKPVLTFYPPIRVQSALRWGPYLPDEKRARVMAPEVYCGQENHCIGSLCNYFPCMRGLTVKQALEQANALLAQGDRP